MRIYPLSSYSVGNYCADISAIGPKELIARTQRSWDSHRVSLGFTTFNSGVLLSTLGSQLFGRVIEQFPNIPHHAEFFIYFSNIFSNLHTSEL